MPLVIFSGFQSPGAVEPQQCQAMFLVFRRAVGIAETCHRDRQASVGEFAAGDNGAIVTDDDASAVFDALA